MGKRLNYQDQTNPMLSETQKEFNKSTQKPRPKDISERDFIMIRIAPQENTPLFVKV